MTPLGASSLDTFRYDLQHALRVLIKSRSFSAVTILTLALGIGVNIALFGVVYSVIVRPLPFPNSARVVTLAEASVARGWAQAPVSYQTFMDWRHQNRTLETLAAFQNTSATLTGEGPAEVLPAAIVGADLFRVLGVNPVAGRTFTSVEESRGAGCAVVISQRLWSERFGRGDVLGRRVGFDDNSCNIVGVAPDMDVPGLGSPAVWLSFSVGLDRWSSAGNLSNRGQRFLGVIGILRSQVTAERADADLKAITANIAASNPKTNREWTISVQPIQEEVTGSIRRPLELLFAAVGLVLLIACANVANLQLARSAARARELSIRIALGCSRHRLFRQIIAENLVLAVIAAGCGWLLASWLLKIVVNVGLGALPRAQEIHLGFTVLLFAIAIALTATFFVGTAPAIVAVRSDPYPELKEGARGITSATGLPKFLRYALMGFQISLSVTVLVTAGLALRSLWALGAVQRGFQPDHVLTARVNPPAKMDPARRSAFYDEVIRRAQLLPGVVAAGAAQVLPLRNSDWSTSFQIVGKPATNEHIEVSYNRVAGDYFESLRIPLRRGRYLTGRDQATSPSVAVVNDAFVGAFLSESTAIGSRIKLWDPDPPFEIVGVVANTAQRSLESAMGAMIYIPYAQRPRSSLTLVMRSRTEPAALSTALRREVNLVLPNQPVAEFALLDDLVAKSMAPHRFPAMLLSFFSLLALSIAGAGIYSIVAYLVAQRTPELGLRLALGADRSSVIRLVLGQAMLIGLLGVVAGCAAALSLTRVLRGLIYGISATDPLTFISVSALLFVVTTLAACVPAVRASHVDPLVALRDE